MSKKINKTEYNRIVELYQSGLSTLKIAEMYNVVWSTIATILKKCDVPLRDNSHKGRIYTLNEDYFDNIDSPNKAYILGLLYADGNNYLPCNNIKIELQSIDKNILEKINTEIGSNRHLQLTKLSLRNENWNDTYRLIVTNKHMSKRLCELGMVPNKSLILTFPQWLSQDLYKDFIRGYFDGDGHIEWNKTKFLTIASTLEFCQEIKNICKQYLNINTCHIYDTANKESNTKVLTITTISNIKKFLDYIYKDSELYIDRKYNKYLEICNTNNENKQPLSA